jgi:hypothetical protein
MFHFLMTWRRPNYHFEHGLDPINVMRDPEPNKRIPTGAWNTVLSPAEAAALSYTEDL